MIRFGLIGATALSLMLSLAIPAVAGDVQNTSTHRYNRHVRTVPPGAIIIGEPSLPIENATARDTSIILRALAVSTATAATPATRSRTGIIPPGGEPRLRGLQACAIGRLLDANAL